MKVYSLLIALVFSLAPALGFAQIDPKLIQFNSEIYDFGTINFGKQKVNATFIFTNNSDIDFTIRDVRASCGCTVPSWPQNPIKPGMTGVITATFDPSNLAGEVDKSIEIFGNFSKIMSKLLYIRGTILEPKTTDVNQRYPGQFGYITQSRNTLGFGNVTDQTEVSATVLFANEYNLPLKFTGIDKSPDYIDISFSNMEIQPGDTIAVTMTLKGAQVKKLGLINTEVVLNTNDRFFKQKGIRVAFNITKDFSSLSKKERKQAPKLQLSQKQFDFGTLKEGAKKTISFKVTNNGKTPLEFLKVSTTCGCAALHLDNGPLAPGESRMAEISFDSIFITGATQKEITLFTNDPNNHVVNLLVIAEVVPQ
jgi:hypothetical protein